MKQLTINDLDDLKMGCSILGSGGGGDPAYSHMMIRYLMEKLGPISLIGVDELTEEDLIVPVSLMGAPLISMERLISGNEISILLEAVEKELGRKPTVIMAAEIGGANAFTPLFAALQWGIPLLDADMIGRAFPELQMSSCFIAKLKPSPAFVVDCLGNRVIIETDNPHTLEKLARSVTVAMGSSAAVGFYLMNGKEAQNSLVRGSVSEALKLGRAVREGKDPIDALLKCSSGTLLGRGMLIDIDQEVEEGFLRGSASVSTSEGIIQLFYQNEYLLAIRGKESLGETPDLLVLLEENSGTPISSERLRYGLQVALVSLPAPPIWKTEEGLQLVGPKVFGYQGG